MSTILLMLCLGLSAADARPDDEADTPGKVVTRFVVAWAERDYETLAGCIDPDWIHDALKAECDEHWPLPRVEREAFVRAYGASSFDELCEESMEAFHVTWIRREWAEGIFPPPPSQPVCRSHGDELRWSQRTSHSGERVWVSIQEEVQDSDFDAYVAVEVWEGYRSMLTGFEFDLIGDGRGRWWITRVAEYVPSE